MNLKQYLQIKQRNPIILIISSILLVLLIIVITKNTLRSINKPVTSNTQIVLTTYFENLNDTIFPVLLLKDNLILHIFTNTIPTDTSFIVALNEGPNIFKLLNKNYKIISTDSFHYKNEKVIFINLK